MIYYTDTERQTLAEYESTIPLTRQDLFYQALMSLDFIVERFNDNDRLVLNKVKNQLITQLQDFREILVKVAADMAKDTNVEDYANIVVEFLEELERATEKLYNSCLEETLTKLTANGVAKLEHELIIPDLEQGSKTRTDWRKLAEKAPEIVKKMYKPAFDIVDSDSRHCHEDW